MLRPAIPLAAAVCLAAAAPASATELEGVRALVLPGEPRAGVVARGDLWVLLDRDGARRLVAVDRRDADVRRQVLIDSGSPGFRGVRPVLTLAGGALWTKDSWQRLLRVDLAEPPVARPRGRCSSRSSGLIRRREPRPSGASPARGWEVRDPPAWPSGAAGSGSGWAAGGAGSRSTWRRGR